MHAILTLHDSMELNLLAALVDKVNEVAPRPQVASVAPFPMIQTLMLGVEELRQQVAALSVDMDQNPHSSRLFVVDKSKKTVSR